MRNLSIGLIFGRQNILKTILILSLVALFIWLGLWQIGRLQQRRDDNRVLAARLAQAPLSLNSVGNDNELLGMIDQQAVATGRFDFDEQVVLKNRNSDVVGPGVHLVAPFVFDDGRRAVIVDRGWLSTADWQAGDFGQYDEPLTTIHGTIQPFDNPAVNTDSAQLTPQSELFRVTAEQMALQSQYELLPIVLMQSGDGDDLTARPWRTTHAVTLSEGNHLSYAFQWFSFAAIFGFGYLFFLNKQADREREQQVAS